MRAASLRNQMLIAMVVGIIFSHLIAISIYSGDRSDVITRTEAEDMVERIAGMVTLMSELDPAMRGMVARASKTAAFQVSLTAEPDVRAQAQSHPLAVALEPYLRAHLPANPGVLIVVESERSSAWPGRLRSLLGGHLLRMLGLAGNDEAVVVHELRSSVRLTSGEWLNVDATLPIRQPHWAGIAGYYIILTAAVFLVLSAYMVVCATKPLKDFAEAANRLGTDLAATPLAETGPSEVVTATRAFNRMQHRLKRLIENRTQMLAAISHDLKTPITLLRLRAEMLETADVRARFIDTLDNMNAMIDSFLDFARQMSHQGPMRKVDISALVEVLCDDVRESGLPVECESDEDIICACRPDDIRRAIGNLVDNAIKYGKRAHVCVRGTCEAVEITVRDEGPGIPPDQLDRVCTPFYRGDASRNPETGGVGLGLSTVKAILHGHGGELYLANLPDGGLLARATLPR